MLVSCRIGRLHANVETRASYFKNQGILKRDGRKCQSSVVCSHAQFHFLRARRGYLWVDMHTLVPFPHLHARFTPPPGGSVVGLATHAKTQTSRGVAAATFSLPQHTSSQAISPQRCPPTPRRPPSPPTRRLDAGDLPSYRQLAGGERQGGGHPGTSRLVETPAGSRHTPAAPRRSAERLAGGGTLAG